MTVFDTTSAKIFNIRSATICIMKSLIEIRYLKLFIANINASISGICISNNCTKLSGISGFIITENDFSGTISHSYVSSSSVIVSLQSNKFIGSLLDRLYEAVFKWLRSMQSSNISNYRYIVIFMCLELQ